MCWEQQLLSLTVSSWEAVTLGLNSPPSSPEKKVYPGVTEALAPEPGSAALLALHSSPGALFLLLRPSTYLYLGSDTTSSVTPFETRP